MSLSVNDDEDWEDSCVQPFTINLDLVTTTHQLSNATLTYSRANCNAISHDIWKFLGNPKLVPSRLSFKIFFGTQTSSLEKMCIKIRIQDQSMHIPFYVANEDQASMNVILG